MDLTQTEVRELAGFFARRFPSYRHRNSLCLAARLPAREQGEAPALDAWVALLEFARRKRALGQLARTAARADAADENLQRVCAELSEGDTPRLVPAALGAVGAMAIVSLGAWWAVRGPVVSPADVPLEQAPVAQAAPARAGTLVSVVPPAKKGVRQFADNPLDRAKEANKTVHAEATAKVLPEAAASLVTPRAPGVRAATPAPAGASTDASPEPPPVPAGAAAAPEEQPETRRAPLANFSGRCTTAEGGLIVYWYAGTDLPGDAGQTITMDHGVYVRADYPDEHNDFDAHSAVRCALRAGDRVRLSMPPMRVPGDKYWVPLVHGDLTPE